MFLNQKWTLAPLFLFLLIQASPLRAISPDFWNMKELLDLNEDAIQFMDICISNLSEDDSASGGQSVGFRKQIADRFRTTLEHDYKAKTWYLQGDYSKTYRELLKSQDSLKKIYKDILINYIDGTHILLDQAIPATIRSEDDQARYYIQTGYRYLSLAKSHFQRGYNINWNLHANQIQIFRAGIREIRQSRRFAIMGLVESRLSPLEKKKFEYISMDALKNYRSGKGKEDKLSPHEYIKSELLRLTGRGLLSPEISRIVMAEKSLESREKKFTLNLLEVHDDNYEIISGNRESVLAGYLKEMFDAGVKEEQQLPNRTKSNRLDISRDSEKKPASGNEQSKPQNPDSSATPATAEPEKPKGQPP